MTWPQIGSLLIGGGILGWAIISFFIGRMDKMKTELFNHLGELKESMAEVCTKTKGQEKRLDRIEGLLNSRKSLNG